MHTYIHDIDHLSKIITIRQINKKGGIGAVPELIDFLGNTSPGIADAAREALFAIAPMASLAERWADDSPIKSSEKKKIPLWLWELCSGWGEKGDFVDLCIEKARSLNQVKANFFLDQVATFQGAERLFIKRLKKYNMIDMQKSFLNKVKSLRSRQFPKQLSLSPTMACQLSCKYCISAGIEANQKDELTFPKAMKIIDWAEKSRIKRIGFTGGEPTLYSHFPKLLKHISEKGFEIYLATNGLGSYKAMKAIVNSRPICVTMHLTPQVIMNGMIQTYIKNAHFLVKEGVYVAMRCNFVSPDENIMPYFKIAAETNIREIRAAIPIPNAGRYNQYIEAVNLRKYGDLLASFVVEGEKRSMATILAKPFFPCKLPAETAKKFFSNGSMSVNCSIHLLNYSNNMIIYPDGSFVPCLGVSLNSRKDIFQFKDAMDAAGMFKAQIERLMKKPLLEECRDCPLWKGGRCLGACLSYRL